MRLKRADTPFAKHHTRVAGIENVFGSEQTADEIIRSVLLSAPLRVGVAFETVHDLKTVMPDMPVAFSQPEKINELAAVLKQRPNLDGGDDAMATQLDIPQSVDALVTPAIKEEVIVKAVKAMAAEVMAGRKVTRGQRAAFNNVFGGREANEIVKLIQARPADVLDMPTDTMRDLRDALPGLPETLRDTAKVDTLARAIVEQNEIQRVERSIDVPAVIRQAVQASQPNNMAGQWLAPATFHEVNSPQQLKEVAVNVSPNTPVVVMQDGVKYRVTTDGDNDLRREELTNKAFAKLLDVDAPNLPVFVGQRDQLITLATKNPAVSFLAQQEAARVETAVAQQPVVTPLQPVAEVRTIDPQTTQLVNRAVIKGMDMVREQPRLFAANTLREPEESFIVDTTNLNTDIHEKDALLERALVIDETVTKHIGSITTSLVAQGVISREENDAISDNIVELVANAVDSTVKRYGKDSVDGRVSVKVVQHDDGVSVQIFDNGHGIKEDV